MTYIITKLESVYSVVDPDLPAVLDGIRVHCRNEQETSWLEFEGELDRRYYIGQKLNVTIK